MALGALAGPMAGAPSNPRAAAATCAVLVSTTGTDNPACGRNPNTPCLTINYSITRAILDGLSCVFVQAGTYKEVVVMSTNVDVIGGYDTQWAPGPYSDAAHRVTVIGGLDAGTGEYLTVRAHNLGAPARLSQMILQGPTAVGIVSGNGRSSYVVHANASQLVLENLQVIAGNGANGLVGTPGINASSSPAPGGGNGANGVESLTACDNTTRGGGGGAGTNSCAGGRNPNGGNGGQGGTKDTECSPPFSFNFTARPGVGGGFAAFNSGTFGDGGSGGPACGPGGNGWPGMVANGSAGFGNNGGTINAAGFWYGNAGGSGAIGENGSGGGGGGGAGGCDTGTDAYGAGGGGGGAGGCRATSGGGGGGGGGGSFGVMAVGNSILTVTNCSFARGNAGAGGAGGIGGRGQPGGAGGIGGSTPDGGNGGNGGKGAHGGHGGGGAGGFGGRSAAIIHTPGTSLTQSLNLFIGGSAGAGGPGGISAPTAPPADDDGNDGQAGAPGTLNTIYVTASGTTGSPERAGDLLDDGGTEIDAATPAVPVAALESPAAVCDLDCATLDAPVPGKGGPLSFAPIVPSPMRGRSQVSFTLPSATPVRILVFDAGGRVVRVLENSFREAGSHTIEWDGRSNEGQPVPVGFYVVRLEAMGRKLSRSVTVLR